MGNSSSNPPSLPPRPVLRERPWRTTLGWEQSVRDQLLTEVQSLHPETNLDVTSFNILLVGQIEAGKSSFINSINSVLLGRISAANAQAGRTGTSLTREFYIYEVSPTLRTYDTMGINPNSCEMDVRNIIQAVEGHVPHQHEFTPGREFHCKSKGYIPNSTFAERPHCVAIVVNANVASSMDSRMVEKLQSLASGLFQRRLPVFIILTHMDEFCEEVQNDITTIYRSTAVEELVNKISTTVLGLPENQIFPVINYTKQVEIDANMDIVILYALRQMLYGIKDHLNNLERDSSTE